MDKSDPPPPTASYDHLSLDVWPACNQEISGEAGDLDLVAVGSLLMVQVMVEMQMVKVLVVMVMVQVMVVTSREETGGIPAPSITVMAI